MSLDSKDSVDVEEVQAKYLQAKKRGKCLWPYPQGMNLVREERTINLFDAFSTPCAWSSLTIMVLEDLRQFSEKTADDEMQLQALAMELGMFAGVEEGSFTEHRQRQIVKQIRSLTSGSLLPQRLNLWTVPYVSSIEPLPNMRNVTRKRIIIEDDQSIQDQSDLFLSAPWSAGSEKGNANIENMNRHLGYQTSEPLLYRLKVVNSLRVPIQLDRVELLSNF